MVTSADSSEGAGTLLRPDLNPLLNPLLAENMGRWAQVYFSSAPEKREAAVLALLRELEARKSENIPLESEAVPSPQPTPVGTVDARQGEQVRCRTCGHDNPSKHPFCGMCGSQMGGTAPEQVKGKTSDGDLAEKEVAEDPDFRQAEADFGRPPAGAGAVADDVPDVAAQDDESDLDA